MFSRLTLVFSILLSLALPYAPLPQLPASLSLSEFRVQRSERTSVTAPTPEASPNCDPVNDPKDCEEG